MEHKSRTWKGCYPLKLQTSSWIIMIPHNIWARLNLIPFTIGLWYSWGWGQNPVSDLDLVNDNREVDCMSNWTRVVQSGPSPGAGPIDMMTSSNGNIFRVTGHWPFVRGIHRSPVNFPHKGQWRGALMFSECFLLCLNKWLRKQSWG